MIDFQDKTSPFGGGLRGRIFPIYLQFVRIAFTIFEAIKTESIWQQK
jgi:hypothetical protein